MERIQNNITMVRLMNISEGTILIDLLDTIY